jgi:RHS repeat-associated protein
MTFIIGVMGMRGAEKPQSLEGRDSALPRYDAAGDMTYDVSNPTAHTYQWDAEGRVSKVDPGLNPPTWVFTYNALGHRVQFASPTMTELHVFDPAGNWLGLANANTYTLVRFGDRHLIVDTPTETYFHHVNLLGSTSIMTGHTGIALEDVLFYPWGDVWQSTGNGGYNFAKIPYYDLSTNTTLANARVLGVNFGRWFSPDPAGKGATKLDDPQTWNMYAYARNNPTTLTDPTGLNACGTDDDSNCRVDVTLTDRTKDKNGNYNDRWSKIKGNKDYNAVATVTVTDGTETREVGTFLARTVPSDSDEFATIANGTYQGTLGFHNGDQVIRLSGAIPTVGPNPSRADGKSIATGILIHTSGAILPDAPLGFTGIASTGPISAGCQLVCRPEYADFKSAVGITPPPTVPQYHFTVTVNTSWNDPTIE